MNVDDTYSRFQLSLLPSAWPNRPPRHQLLSPEDFFFHTRPYHITGCCTTFTFLGLGSALDFDLDITSLLVFVIICYLLALDTMWII